MKSIRLLPVVIFAALALLVFKGIGLVTNGGYVLTGPGIAVAEGGGHSNGEGGDAAAPASGDPTVTDSSPTLEDSTPMLPSAEGAGQHGAAAEKGGGHAAPAEGASTGAGAGEHGAPAAAGHDGSEAEGTGHATSEAPGVPCLNPDATPAAEGNEAASENIKPDNACATPSYPTDANGDALPMVSDNTGKVVPLQAAGDENSQEALTKRLAERRAELDKREGDLQTREALLAAAEQKLAEKSQELAALQAQIDAMVDQKKAADDAGFQSIVSMYEQMKPKQAAAIFDTLDLTVLLRVAKAMNPRKMSPILALMSPAPAEALTTALATAQPELTVPAGTSENLAALPQIVGK